MMSTFERQHSDFGSGETETSVEMQGKNCGEPYNLRENSPGGLRGSLFVRLPFTLKDCGQAG